MDSVATLKQKQLFQGTAIVQPTLKIYWDVRGGRWTIKGLYQGVSCKDKKGNCL